MVQKGTFQAESTQKKEGITQRKDAQSSTNNRPERQTGKVKLYAPFTGSQTEVDAGKCGIINYLKSQGYSENPSAVKTGKAEWALKVGENNNTSNVIVLQKVLVLCEYLDVPMDTATKKHVQFGAYGELTRQAVIKMQRENGLKQDGAVGPMAWKAFPLPQDDANNQPNRYSNKYQAILKNNNIYLNGNKDTDNPDIRYSKLHDQGLKSIKEATGREEKSDSTSSTPAVGEFRAYEGGRYVLYLYKYKDKILPQKSTVRGMLHSHN